MKSIIIPLLVSLFLTTPLNAQETDTTDYREFLEAYEAYLDSVRATLTLLSDTTVVLGDGLAELTVPEDYYFIDAADTYTVIVDMWGNPPENGQGSLGMLLPRNHPIGGSEGYGIDIFFTEDGYINDEDAAEMDYDELLVDLRESIKEENEGRAAAGYEPIYLEGWAAAPHYDAVNKRLHWAKDLYFEGDETNTLNYNILFLGRRGHLTMNVIGDLDDLPEINGDLEDILSSTTYLPGHRYADFDPSIDEVAAYGIGALIAGKMLLKTGVLASIGIFLLKAWKLIAIGGVALWAGVRKLLGNQA